MTLTKLPIRSGVVKDDPNYQSEGVWIDSDKVRFWRGLPQKIGGWTKYVSDTFSGKCRGVFQWKGNDGSVYIAIGTHTNLYVATTTAIYDITPAGFSGGLEYGSDGVGWGAGQWSHDSGWGGSVPVATNFAPLTWSFATFGQNLLACNRNGKIYQWNLDTTAVAAEVSGAPAQVGTIFVTPERFAIAVGAVNVATGAFDSMHLRWSNQNDQTTWTTSATNLAGDFNFSGSVLVAGTASRFVNLIWSDEALYSMRYLGDEVLVFGFDLLGRNCGLIGPNAFVEKDGLAFWMAPNEQFYMWNGGSPAQIECPVRDFVFDSLVAENQDAVYAGINARFNEVWWFYPTNADTPELDRYVIYNWSTNEWAVGSLNRTAWADNGTTRLPIAAGDDGYLYSHESGVNADGSAITAYIESAPFDIGDGDRVMNIYRIVPDLTLTGSVDITLSTKRYPQGATEFTRTVNFATSDTKIDILAEGRQAQIRVQSDEVGDDWRFGNARIGLRPGGYR